MNKIIKNITLIGLAIVGTTAWGQQTILTNFAYKNLYSVNPASAGTDGSLSMALTHRQQWIGVTGAPASGSFNLHSPFGKNNAAGMQVRYDSYGLMYRVGAKATYVYNLKVANEHIIGFGLSAGFSQSAVNYTAVRTQDYSDDLVLEGERVAGFAMDADFGINYRWKGLQVGIASLQLIQTRGNFYLENDAVGQFNLTRHFVANVNYEIQPAPDWTMTPVVLTQFTAVSPFTVEGMLYTEWDKKIYVGLGYRRNAGLLTSIGCKIADQLSAGYSYEMGFSGIAGQSRGTHEIMIGFTFNGGGNKKVIELERKMEETNQRVSDLETTVEEMNKELDNVLENMKGDLEELKKNEDENKAKIQDLEKRIETLENKKQELSPASNEDVMDNLLYFQHGKSVLDAASQDRLDEMIQVMKKDGKVRIKIKGHTDNTGSNDANEKLSLERAEKVKSYFVKAGIPSGRVQTVGAGSSEPLYPNDTQENKDRNRRVEVIVL